MQTRSAPFRQTEGGIEFISLPNANGERTWPGLSAAGVAVLLSMEQAGHALRSADESTIGLASLTVAKLDDARATALGLPPPPPYRLDIDGRGALGSMALQTQWVDADGLRGRKVEPRGSLISIDGTLYRLASPLFEILGAVDAFNRAGFRSASEQAADWGIIQGLIGISPGDVSAGRFLNRIRVARASHFSLDFVPAADGFQIAPVPLAPRPRALGRSEDDSLADAPAGEPVRLLRAGEQQTFQRAFHGRKSVQSSYLAGDDLYVIPSPDVLKYFAIVRDIQEEPPAERLKFAQNPYAFFPREEDTADSPFIESRSFSDRVLGVGRIDRVSLPWQILAGQGWLPPHEVTVRLGEGEIKVPPHAIEPAVIDIEYALAVGEPDVHVAGHTLEATEATHHAFLEARDALDNQAASDSGSKAAGNKRAELIGLQVTRNLEESAYQSKRRVRPPIETGVPEIATPLKPHQQEAVAWLERRWLAGYRGALLADDMGLGKSLTTLSFMMWLRRAMASHTIPPKPMLIVAPVGLLANWQAEHERHIAQSPGHFVDIVRAYGQGLVRTNDGAESTLDLEAMSTDRFGRPTCILTTYETLRDHQQSFGALSFALVVLDEAQRVKNPGSLTWHAVSVLNADFWLALTGTPVENRLADLWAIADIIEPGLLGHLKSFSETYETKFDEVRLRQLKALLESEDSGAAFMLRRMKDQALPGLPAKHEYLKPRPMPPIQADAYDKVVADSRTARGKSSMLAAIQRLRDVSLSPLEGYGDDHVGFVDSSARMQSLFEILDAVRDAGEKALIFVDRNLIEAYLAMLIQERYNLPTLPPIINGEVPGHRRQQLVDEFQRAAGFRVMLLSPRAGGVGLTLTAANHVIHLSRWWNPAVEDQATDRVYRIGQRRPVHVYYLQAVLDGQPGLSFDERLHELLSKKRSLSHDVLWPFQGHEGDAAQLLGTAQP